MRDMHCHILPGVDDGSPDMETSLVMLDAAKQAGVTSIVCTPHVRSPYFKDLDVLWGAYHRLKEAAGGFPITMGFEVNHTKLMELGLEEWAPYLGFEGTGEFLLELDTRCTEADFQDYERTIFALQGMGYDVIIAHPERYRAIQQNTEFIAGGRMGREKKPAQKMFDQLLYRYIASDAHKPEHYALLAKAVAEYPTRGAHMRV